MCKMTVQTSPRPLALAAALHAAFYAAMAASTTLAYSAGFATGAQASGLPLAPHRAIYDISLDRTAAGSGVAELTGRMVYELKGNACKGYEQRIRFVTRTQSPKGKETVMDLRSTYRELQKPGQFDFETQQFRDDRLLEETIGTARRAPKGNKLTVQLRKPLRKRMTFDKQTLYPIEHTVRILEAARAGKRIYMSDLYDGSEKGLKVYETTAVIGDRKPAGHNKSLPEARNAGELDRVASWPVSLSYFNPSDKREDAVPEYELAFLFFDNGVSRRLFIDYGSFAIRAKLVGLTMFEASPCTSGR